MTSSPFFIGLITNSVVVIVASMLVSPLMGPVMGVSLLLEWICVSRLSIEMMTDNLALTKLVLLADDIWQPRSGLGTDKVFSS